MTPFLLDEASEMATGISIRNIVCLRLVTRLSVADEFPRRPTVTLNDGYNLGIRPQTLFQVRGNPARYDGIYFSVIAFFDQLSCLKIALFEGLSVL